jgi:F-type H+-transporting ATPase subunit epsilon
VADSLRLTVVTPERALIDTDVDEVQLPGLDGYLGILPRHAAMFSELSIGRLTYFRRGEKSVLAIAGGFVEVLDNHVRVLATVAEAQGDIDAARAREALERARQRLGGKGEDVDYERALRASHRAASRLDVAG